MKVRMKNNPNITGISNKFNTSSTGEVIIYFDDFENLDGTDSVYISDLEVFITKNKLFLLNKPIIPECTSVGHWIPMNEAFKNKDLIIDNYNIYFFEPKDNEEKNRGYRLTEHDLDVLNASMEDTGSAPQFY